MLAEFSDEHANLFQENIEAVFFRDNNDLLLKVSYYLENDCLRNAISENGFNRCTKSNYFYYNLYLSLFNKLIVEDFI